MPRLRRRILRAASFTDARLLEESPRSCSKMLAAEHDLLTTPEVAELLKVSERTVRTWTHTGILKAIRIGGRVLYRRGILTALLEGGT